MITNDQAMDVVQQLAVYHRYFPTSEIDRAMIAGIMVSMVNWPPEKKVFSYDDEGNRYEVPYIQPMARLQFILDSMMVLREWPGASEMRAIYGGRFTSADGVDVGETAVPEFITQGNGMRSEGMELVFAKNPNAPYLPYKKPERKYLPQPGDVPNDILAQIPGAAKRLGGGK